MRRPPQTRKTCAYASCDTVFFIAPWESARQCCSQRCAQLHRAATRPNSYAKATGRFATPEALRRAVITFWTTTPMSKQAIATECKTSPRVVRRLISTHEEKAPG